MQDLDRLREIDDAHKIEQMFDGEQENIEDEHMLNQFDFYDMEKFVEMFSGVDNEK